MLVIFDCDGVLVDSEVLAARVFSEALAQEQIHLTAQECFREFKGKSLKDCFALIKENFQYVLPENFKQSLDAQTQSAFANELTAVAGVEKLIQFLLGKNISICVASNGGREKIHHSLQVTGLSHYFENKFSAEDVENAKPSPELFLLAAESCGVPPAFCYVIEDSETGFRAAQSAEMHLLKFVSTNSASIELDMNTYTSMQAIQGYFESVLN